MKFWWTSSELTMNYYMTISCTFSIHCFCNSQEFYINPDEFHINCISTSCERVMNFTRNVYSKTHVNSMQTSYDVHMNFLQITWECHMCFICSAYEIQLMLPWNIRHWLRNACEAHIKLTPSHCQLVHINFNCISYELHRKFTWNYHVIFMKFRCSLYEVSWNSHVSPCTHYLRKSQ